MAAKRTIAFVGGGLANGLAAFRLRQRRPEVDLLVLERGDRLGGDHTWCLHGSDLAAGDPWLLPLLSKTWDSHEVRFPGAARTVAGTYGALRSPDFHTNMMAALGDRVCCVYENGQLKTTTMNGQQFVFVFSGTSFSAPQIAGAVALLRQAFPNLTAAQTVGARMLWSGEGQGVGEFFEPARLCGPIVSRAMWSRIRRRR